MYQRVLNKIAQVLVFQNDREEFDIAIELTLFKDQHDAYPIEKAFSVHRKMLNC